jgi:hypothetical protein
MHTAKAVVTLRIKKNLYCRVCCKRLHEANVSIAPVKEDLMWIIGPH